jgi:hypothetical protein
MRLYGKRFIKRSMQQQVADRVETRDALVWSVDRFQRWCGVVVQNAPYTNVTKAYFPSGWMEVPQWLKVGNSVRITHTGGVRGRIEIVSQGCLTPRPIGGAPPGAPLAEDAVISGLQVVALPVPEMRIAVTPGVVRFSGVRYTLSSIYMDTPNYEMGMGGSMDSGYVYISPVISAPATSNFRYDLFQIGTDRVIDRVVGGQSTSNPAMPALSSSHLRLGHVLLWSGMTSIVGNNIGATWFAAYPAALQMTIADNSLLWTELTTSITLAMKTQYGGPVNCPDCIYRLEFVSGNGTIKYGAGGTPSSTYLEVQSSGSSVTFTYTRIQVGAQSPSFLGSIVESPIGMASGSITLWDNSVPPNPMY